MTNANQSESTIEKVREMLENSEVESERREELLRAMLGVARGVTDKPTGNDAPDLREDFDKAFEPLSKDQVDRFLLYRNATPPMIVQNPETGPTMSQNSEQ